MKILMPEYKTLTTGDIDMSGFDRLGDLVILDHPTREELKAELKDTDILFVNKIVVDEDLLDGAEKLRYVGECATGYNNIDVRACNERGITVTFVPAYSTNAVAQHVFALMLDHFSRVRDYSIDTKAGGWTASGAFANMIFPTEELDGKTLGLVGYGRIGQQVAAIAHAFGMEILATSRTFVSGWSGDGITRFTDLKTLLKTADVVSVHIPLNDASYHLFDREKFDLMKEGAFFINTARGPIVDEAALAESLRSGHLSGAALDVLEEEPMNASCVLKEIPNCTITPHVAWAPIETRQRLVDVVLENVQAFLEGSPLNVVEAD